MENENTEKLEPIKVEETIDNGLIESVHIAPIGEFTGSDTKGNPVEQVLDAESLEKLADKLNAGDEVLADIDHGSSKPGTEKDTRSAGWFSKFVVDPIKGLFGMLKLTKTGKELIENREYRYISPAFILDENRRPVDMVAASLTNRPAFKGAISPIINTCSEEQDKKETIYMEMTKEELIGLIKETIAGMEKTEETLNACSDEKKEDAEEVKNQEETSEEEIKEEIKEEASEGETKEEIKEELKEEAKEAKEEAKEEKEEEKEEVIKLESLNSASDVKISQANPWANLHGQAFFDWLRQHPEGI